MIRFMFRFVLFLLVLCVGAALYKGAQKLLWETDLTFISPASLDSWDPTERYEAARQAANKFGGLK